MINKDRVISIQQKIKNAISNIEKEENISIKFGNVKYSVNDYSTTMSIVSNVKDINYDKLQEVISKRLGFSQNIIGMNFNHPKIGVIKITEFKTNYRKYPVIGVSLEGKRYKFDTTSIKLFLGGDKLINRSGNLDKLLG